METEKQSFKLGCKVIVNPTVDGGGESGEVVGGATIINSNKELVSVLVVRLDQGGYMLDDNGEGNLRGYVSHLIVHPDNAIHV